MTSELLDTLQEDQAEIMHKMAKPLEFIQGRGISETDLIRRVEDYRQILLKLARNNYSLCEAIDELQQRIEKLEPEKPLLPSQMVSGRRG